MSGMTSDRLEELRRIAEAGPEGEWDVIELEHSTVLAMLDEIERLRREVSEWMCDGCNTVYPGPPQPGIWCVQCPRCGGDTAPRGAIERRRLEREVERLRRVVDEFTDFAEHGGRFVIRPMAETITVNGVVYTPIQWVYDYLENINHQIRLQAERALALLDGEKGGDGA